ncbi:hypothetical protein GBAR_LOCUS7012 [Geodia barretti]|uniref:Uncharacterized protein n=1 Tax=Geodia barretti TaxID=519541 RepID=A0AA35WDM1_GEOBA|nr:hypothetical protein GBAR_LOCUS7012 [Geodia barretti]
MAGTYTCVANQFTLTMNSSVEIIVHFACDVLMSTDMIIVNMSSTAVGSTATYQCRDSPTDVYTTQCTSTGVWHPHPDCTSKETGQTSTLQPCQIGVIILSLIVLVQTGLLVGALVKIVLLTKKGSEQKTREERLEMDVNVAYGTPKEIMALRTSNSD